MSVTTDTRIKMSTIIANIACTNEEHFPVMFKTTFQSMSYDSSTSTFNSKASTQIGNLSANNTFSVDVTYLISDAADDLTDHVTDAFGAVSNQSVPVLVTAYTSYEGSDTSLPSWWCPPVTSKINTTCTTTVPLIWSDSTSWSLTLLDVNGNYAVSGPSNYSLAINNAMQAMLAAVRMDLGNVLPNNILVNRSSELISRTIAPVFPVQGANDSISTLYRDLVAPSTSGDYSPIDPGSDGPATIALEYQCRVEQRKGPGSIVIAVVVATVTLFKTGWAVFLLLLTFWAKRAEPEGQKSCTGHEALEARIQELERRLSTPSLEKRDDI
ncbi:hypothetical protein FRB94_007497 [Tulasnella sp. JGI-2019a]|nr:hypothetical protein FRB94_007497 [Tulasnella sp. JGI-2019a]